MLEKSHYQAGMTLGAASAGVNIKTPDLPERPTDGIKEYLLTSLAMSGQIVGKIDKEENRLMGPRPVLGMDAGSDHPEGDMPELLFLAREVSKRMHYIDARLSFLSEI